MPSSTLSGEQRALQLLEVIDFTATSGPRYGALLQEALISVEQPQDTPSGVVPGKVGVLGGVVETVLVHIRTGKDHQPS